MVRVTEAEARKRLGELIQDVRDGRETVMIEKDGEPQAVVISLDEYTRLRAKNQGPGEQDWKRRVDRVRERVAQELKGRSLPPAEEVIRRMREERDEQILGHLR
jgi:prevent-host-death family protein